MIQNKDKYPWKEDLSKKEGGYGHTMAPIPLPSEQGRIGIREIINNTTDLIFLPIADDILFTGLAYPITIDDEGTFKILKYLTDELDKKGHTCYIVVGYPQEGAKELYYKEDEINEDSILKYGVLCEVARLFDSNGNSNNLPAVVLSTIGRVSIKRVWYSEEKHSTSGFYSANVGSSSERLKGAKSSKEFFALIQTIQELSIELIQQMTQDFPSGILDNIRESTDSQFIVNFACSILPLRAKTKYTLLSEKGIKQRAESVLKYLQEALSMQSLKNEIRSKTQAELDKQQKEYFLNQQIRTIQQELGNEEEGNSDIKELQEKAKTKKWLENVTNTFNKELNKLEHLHPQSPDYAIQYQYLQTLVDLPWGEYTKDEFDLKKAEKILNEDHCGLEKVKERIIEHLAVLKLRKDMKSPILCFWGPPGVGKTSLGKSIAKALGRKYVRVSLGGLHDEAEIRGHRRTYVGALPGRIIQSIKKAGTSNPVILLDEIDKVSSDYKGDPESALLEVLDPEQNKAFHDNYIDIDYDLSNVFFIATANTLNSISSPLLDRMELIEMSGYIEEEKVDIAQQHLIPKQLEEHGLATSRFTISDAVLRFIINGYTRESGVRKLEKQIASICRKIAHKIAIDDLKPSKKAITKTDIEEFLGPEKYTKEEENKKKYYGVVTGLAWTSVGGEILYIETSIHNGKDGQLILTGNLGNVMKESASIALDYIRAHTTEIGLSEDIFKDKAIHIHVPEGAIPKDGPSAGITMVTSLVSAIGRRYVKPHFAMTGEMTLRGKVLPVGGVKEKILAAKRMGITDIILCADNKKDIDQIKEIYIKGLRFHYVRDISEVLETALEPSKK